MKREELARGFSNINDLDEAECLQIASEIEKIPVNERTFEEKMALNLTKEKCDSFHRVRKEKEEATQKVDLEERLAILEEKVAKVEEDNSKR